MFVIEAGALGESAGLGREGDQTDELERIRLVTLETEAGTVAQRTRLDDKHRSILQAMELPEPPRYHDFVHVAG